MLSFIHMFVYFLMYFLIYLCMYLFIVLAEMVLHIKVAKSVMNFYFKCYVFKNGPLLILYRLVQRAFKTWTK